MGCWVVTLYLYSLCLNLKKSLPSIFYLLFPMDPNFGDLLFARIRINIQVLISWVSKLRSLDFWAKHFFKPLGLRLFYTFIPWGISQTKVFVFLFFPLKCKYKVRGINYEIRTTITFLSRQFISFFKVKFIIILVFSLKLM